ARGGEGVGPARPGRRLAGPRERCRRAPTAAFGWRGEGLEDERMPREEAMDDRPMDAPPKPVDQAHLREASPGRLAEILLDDGRDVPGREGVQVEGVLDGQDDRILIVHFIIHALRLPPVMGATRPSGCRLTTRWSRP